MTLFGNKYRIQSTRLPEWDYGSDGYYFVTICTKGMVEWFGEIRKGIMGLNELGCAVHKQWGITGKIRKNVELDTFVVMPNHVHGIIVIHAPVETHCNVSLRNASAEQQQKYNQFGPQRNNLASIVRGFKSSVKLWCNQSGYSDFSWQSNYYDRIIRNERELNRIQSYIQDNPINWEIDRNHSKDKPSIHGN
ncbi:transposase [Candidatus Peregrinibacteria bacterium CG_4_10_14_0_2_um_filter_43_11]|nr:MAG: transposase [Candidatus Peregrinibacteria bacterium CG_4_10_14_0_2_um_filter_43_11]